MEVVAVENQRRAGRAGRIGAQAQARDDARGVGVEADVEIDRVDQIVRRAVIGQAYGLGDGGGFKLGGHSDSFELRTRKTRRPDNNQADV